MVGSCGSHGCELVVHSNSDPFLRWVVRRRRASSCVTSGERGRGRRGSVLDSAARHVGWDKPGFVAVALSSRGTNWPKAVPHVKAGPHIPSHLLELPAPHTSILTPHLCRPSRHLISLFGRWSARGTTNKAVIRIIIIILWSCSCFCRMEIGDDDRKREASKQCPLRSYPSSAATINI